MSERNANRPGYKKTRVGWIPEEWRLKRIDEIGNVITGGTPSKSDETNYGNFLPWITASDMGRKYIFDTEIKLSEHGAKKGRIAPRGAVLVTCIASIGLNGIITEKMGFNQQINAVVVNSENNNEFFYYLIDFYKHRMIRLAGKTAVPIINKSNFQSLILPIPSLNEQNIIAEILSTWDRAIEQTRQLIDAKRRLKKGLMQQLLMGRMRFPGFGSVVEKAGELPEGWKEKKITEIAEVIVSNVDKKINETETPVLLCNYLDVFDNYFISSSLNFMSATASQREIEKFTLRKFDVLITKDSETSEDIANTSIVLEDVKHLVCGYHLAVLRPNRYLVDGLFLSYMLDFGNVHHHFVSHANGVTRFGLTISIIKNTKIPLPSINEQRRISSTFFKLDNEIEYFEEKIDLFDRQKKGLMQKLSTGEVRVKA